MRSQQFLCASRREIELENVSLDTLVLLLLLHEFEFASGLHLLYRNVRSKETTSEPRLASTRAGKVGAVRGRVDVRVSFRQRFGLMWSYERLRVGYRSGRGEHNIDAPASEVLRYVMRIPASKLAHQYATPLPIH